MSRTIPTCDGAPAGTVAKPGANCPAKRLYADLRRDKGMSHEEATRHLRTELKRFFRPA